MSAGVVAAAVCVSHAPGIRAWPERAAPERFAAFEAAFGELRRRIAALAPDAIVSISSDHFTCFSLALMPGACVGLGDANEGPAEDWLRMARARVPGYPALGRAIVEQGFEDGLDLAHAQELLLDHGTMVPLSYLTPAYDVPVVPILQNCLVAPLPPVAGSLALGRSLRRAIARSGLRVVVVGSGGLSHWPGDLRHGEINVPLDRRFLALVERGDVETLGAWDAELAAGGAGMFEVRNWVAAMAAARAPAMEVLFYEPFEGLATGCAAAMSRA